MNKAKRSQFDMGTRNEVLCLLNFTKSVVLSKPESRLRE